MIGQLKRSYAIATLSANKHPHGPLKSGAGSVICRTGTAGLPRASSGNCYEPGEFCPLADAGMTGVAGDGKAIICENNNGLRWEPT